MIIIIDYGSGNTGSLCNMVRKVGGDANLSSDINEINRASSLILPGVGSFDHVVRNLKNSGLLPTIANRVLEHKIPILGVCVGMQLLFEHSEEGKEDGLGWIPGVVKRFDVQFDVNAVSLKIPHMGWNQVSVPRKVDLFAGLEESNRFYFVHSYHAVCKSEYVIGRATYGNEFTCAVQRNNIYGVQFHPEKSHKFGMQLFSNFLNIT